MLHNISAFDLINSAQDINPGKQHINTYNEGYTPLLANTTSIQEDISPADIRKVLSTSNSPTKVANSSSSNDTAVTIDDIKYRQCNMDKTYMVSTYRRKPSSSLVDRGEHGGITGDNIRCITTRLERTMVI